MDSNPFDRIPDVPLSRPAAPSPVGGMEPTQLVPDYAIENPGRGETTSDPATIDVITALLASGATFVEKTGCNSGTPYTYWAPEWTTDPS